MTGDTVSVVVPTFNAAAFVERALRSLLAQHRPPDEIIVVDDCSTDATRSVLDAFAARAPSMRVLSTGRNGGPSVARNVGLAAAGGDWIATLDADDAFEPRRLSRLLEDPAAASADILVDDIVYYDAAARRTTGRALGAGAVLPPGPIGLHEFLARNVAREGSFDWGLLKPVFRSAALRRTSLGYDPQLRHGEDFRFVVQLLRAGLRYTVVNEPLYIYTQRSGGISGRASGMTRTTIAYDKLRDDALRLSEDRHIASDPRLVALLRQRAHGLGILDDAAFVSASLRSGAVLPMARRAWSRPGFSGRLLRQVARALRRRLAGSVR